MDSVKSSGNLEETTRTVCGHAANQLSTRNNFEGTRYELVVSSKSRELKYLV